MEAFLPSNPRFCKENMGIFMTFRGLCPAKSRHVGKNGVFLPIS
jgi:hypothetical protein